MRRVSLKSSATPEPFKKSKKPELAALRGMPPNFSTTQPFPPLKQNKRWGFRVPYMYIYTDIHMDIIYQKKARNLHINLFRASGTECGHGGHGHASHDPGGHGFQ